MTIAEFEAESKRLELLIRQADAGKKDPSKTLAEKIECNRLRNKLQQQLRDHRFRYFDLVVE